MSTNAPRMDANCSTARMYAIDAQYNIHQHDINEFVARSPLKYSNLQSKVERKAFTSVNDVPGPIYDIDRGNKTTIAKNVRDKVHKTYARRSSKFIGRPMTRQEILGHITGSNGEKHHEPAEYYDTDIGDKCSMYKRVINSPVRLKYFLHI